MIVKNVNRHCMVLLCTTPTKKVLKRNADNITLTITDKTNFVERYICRFLTQTELIEHEKKCINALNY